MTNTRVILLSAATYLVLNLLGPFTIFLSIWVGLGYLGERIYKRYGYESCKIDFIISLIAGPLQLAFAMHQNNDEICEDIKKFLNK
jgi:hypothetical protein